MIKVTLCGMVLVAITVALHAVGLAWTVRRLIMSPQALPARPWPIAWLLIRVTWMLLAFHVLEIAVWALFFTGASCLPDAESAFYFSGVTYATIGYGDLVLPKPWRMLGPVEGLTGILMCGLSAGVFVTLITRIYNARFEGKRA